MKRHGFNVEGQITDDILLDIDKETIKMMMSQMTYTEYLRWKCLKLKDIISDTVGTTTLDEQSKLTYRLKSLKYNEGIL